MNAQKCTNQCSKLRPHGDCTLRAGSLEFPIVSRDEGFKILGTLFTLNGNLDVELERRQDAAWAKFHQLAPLLLRRDASLVKRLQLFQTTVSQTLLWGAESWTLTAKQKRQLRSVQREMLRRIVRIRRQPQEEWIDWVKRATKVAEELANKAGTACWIRRHLQMKWRWAGRIARMPWSRWARRVTLWRDCEWSEGQLQGASAYGARPMRSRPGQFQRWESELCKYCAHVGAEEWPRLAAREDSWETHTEAFVDLCWR